MIGRRVAIKTPVSQPQLMLAIEHQGIPRLLKPFENPPKALIEIIAN
jgi:hypothetical protein